MNTTVAVSPYYIEAKNEITKPTYFVATSQYFVDCWMPRLGPLATCIVLCLRRRGYLNQQTGERRDRFVIAQKEIADACCCSVATIRREIGANEALKAFLTIEPQYERNEKGHVRQLENVYHIAMDDPLIPEDEPRLEALIAEREAQQLAREPGRKTIRNVVAQNERVGGDVVAHFDTPPLQNERLRHEATLSLNLSDLESIPNAESNTLRYYNNNSAREANSDVVGAEEESVVVVLCASGISPGVAENLARTEDHEMIRKQIRMLSYRGAQDPAAVLVKAIREQWAAPAAFTAAEAEQAAQAQRQLREAQRAQRQQRQQREREAQASRVEAHWAELEGGERQRIEAEARDLLRHEKPMLAARLGQNGQSAMALAALEEIRQRLVAAHLGSSGPEQIGVGE